VNYPGVADPLAQRQVVQSFLDYVQSFPNTWIVSNAQVRLTPPSYSSHPQLNRTSLQMLGWLQNPVTNANIAQVDSLKCSTPDVTEKICNGMEQNEQGLLNKCSFEAFPWTT
jgi:hypothetical protein